MRTFVSSTCKRIQSDPSPLSTNLSHPFLQNLASGVKNHSVIRDFVPDMYLKFAIVLVKERESSLVKLTPCSTWLLGPYSVL